MQSFFFATVLVSIMETPQDDFGNADLKIAFQAALAAAKIVLQYWDAPKEYETKEDSHFDLVSFVDQSADAAIHAVLQNLCPKDNILSEEIFR